MATIDPSVVALLGGMGGAVLMLLIVLLAVIGFALPVGRAVLRFVGNFDSMTASRSKSGKVQISGGFDDWREFEEPQAEPPLLGGTVRAIASGDVHTGTVVTHEPEPAQNGKGSLVLPFVDDVPPEAPPQTESRGRRARPS
jgi:hypothetical protein